MPISKLFLLGHIRIDDQYHLHHTKIVQKPVVPGGGRSDDIGPRALAIWAAT